MATPDSVTRFRNLPDSVTVTDAGDIRFSPNEMRRLKAETGRSMTDLMGEDGDDADRLQAVAWLELRRAGHDPTWDEAGDVAIRFVADTPDPTNAGSSTPSPASAGSGA